MTSELRKRGTKLERADDHHVARPGHRVARVARGRQLGDVVVDLARLVVNRLQ